MLIAIIRHATSFMATYTTMNNETYVSHRRKTHKRTPYKNIDILRSSPTFSQKTRGINIREPPDNVFEKIKRVMV